MRSVNDVAEELVTKNIPALLLDTCILLDTIRAIERRDTRRIEAAKYLLQEVTASSPRLIIVVSSIVLHEWQQNAQRIVDEAEKYVSELKESATHFRDVCCQFSYPTEFTLPDFDSYALPQKLHDLSKKIVDAATCIDPNEQSQKSAFQRVLDKAPPSQKGKGIKDCAIIENYFELSRQSRSAGFQKNLVFCTSNTKDFGKRGGLHPDLVAEFAATKLGFTTELHWARHELGR